MAEKLDPALEALKILYDITEFSTHEEVKKILKIISEDGKQLMLIIHGLHKSGYVDYAGDKIKISEQGRYYVNFFTMSSICAFHRGSFLHAVTSLEKTIDDILAFYFCADSEHKREEFTYALLKTEMVTLSTKYKLITFIVRRNFPDFDKKYNYVPTNKKNKSNHPPTLHKRIRKYIELRNIFAHREFMLEYDDISNFDGKTVSLDGKVVDEGKLVPDPLPITEDFVNESVKEVVAIADTLNELFELIKKAPEK